MAVSSEVQWPWECQGLPWWEVRGGHEGLGAAAMQSERPPWMEMRGSHGEMKGSHVCL